jgi:hypothetical protein
VIFANRSFIYVSPQSRQRARSYGRNDMPFFLSAILRYISVLLPKDLRCFFKGLAHPCTANVCKGEIEFGGMGSVGEAIRISVISVPTSLKLPDFASHRTSYLKPPLSPNKILRRLIWRLTVYHKNLPRQSMNCR